MTEQTQSPEFNRANLYQGSFMGGANTIAYA